MIRCRTQDQAHNEKRLTFKTKTMGNWSLRTTKMADSD